ncbi:MAG: alpha/beta hydrolase [Chloroflexota bacterium]
MLFITNRTLKQSKRTRIGRNIDFDLKDNLAGQSVFFCQRDGKEEYTEIGNQAFFKALREGPHKQILLYIHGYSNLPETHIFPTAAALQSMFDKKEKNLVQVVPLIWPCDDDGKIVQDYWDDQQAADASAHAFSRVFEKFMAWRETGDDISEKPCTKRVNVLAHSMGNRVFRGAIKAWGKYHRAYRLPLLFRNQFLMAADIINEALEGQDGGLIAECTRNIAVYFSADDMALRASKAANLANKVASRRLGHTGPENMNKVPQNVYAIDCDEVADVHDPSGLGHSYFLYDEGGAKGKKPGAVFEHMFEAIKTGRVPVEASGDKTLILKA